MLLDMFFPRRCVGCSQMIESDKAVCDACLMNIRFSYDDFGTKSELWAKCNLLFPLENAFALIIFDEVGLGRKLIHQLKYDGIESIGKIFADWTAQRLNFGEDKPDLLVTIPLHPKKQRIRGYNQLHLYAEELSKFYDIPFDHQALKRVKFQRKAQAKRNAEERKIKGQAFALNKDIRGKHILLIDDVITTGNTMSAAAWELLKNENKLSILVMAVDL